MTIRFVLDPKLQDYCTEKQWSYLLEWSVSGTAARAAKVLGVSERNLTLAKAAVLKKAARQGYAPEFDLVHPVPEGMTSAGVSILYDEITGKPVKTWNKSKPAGRDPAEAVHIPDPKSITKTATYFGSDGNVIGQWVSEKPAEIAKEKLWREFAAALAADMPRAEPVWPPQKTDSNLCAVYPVGDHHLGMFSWSKETGADYDLKIGEKLLADAIDHLVLAAPACDTSVVALMGDFLHYDSYQPVTPTSRNMLDSDGRYPKMVDVAIRSARYLIEAALRRHKHVTVIVEPGNHDLSTAIFLGACLRNIYENDPRVTINTSPRHYHYFEFGQNLLGTHHGHGAKMKDLPLIMASDMPEAWGRTRHRWIITGHLHQDIEIEVNGTRVECIRVLPPVDAWAHQKGYRSGRSMKAMVLHREHGEVARHTVNPGMFQ